MFRRLPVAAVAGARMMSSAGAATVARPMRSPLVLGTTAALGLGLVTTGLTVSLAEDVDIKAVRASIADILDKEDYDDGSLGPVFVRLAWHSSGSYNKATATGGSNGATMRFKPESHFGANAGLNLARDELEVIKAKHPGISYADLYTLAAVVAIEEMGGPAVPWKAGRTDATESKVPDGRLPDADKGAGHVRDIFYAYGFNDQEIVALAGAHALGRCHNDRSGFEGPWTNAPTTFSNEYFRLLIEEKWIPGKSGAGQDQYWNPDKTLMMTEADLAFRDDPEFRKYTEIYAKDEDKFFADFAAACGKLFALGVPGQDPHAKGILGTVLGWLGF